MGFWFQPGLGKTSWDQEKFYPLSSSLPFLSQAVGPFTQAALANTGSGREEFCHSGLCSSPFSSPKLSHQKVCLGVLLNFLSGAQELFILKRTLCGAAKFHGASNPVC